MLALEQFAAKWGKDDLVPIPTTMLRDLNIPQDDKDFLAQAGLPQAAAIPTGGAGDFALLSVQAGAEPDKPKYPLLSEYEHSYYLLGFIRYSPDFGHDTYFCIEKHSGAIRLIDNEDPSVYFVNSSVSAFAQALLAYRSFIEPSSNDPLKDKNRGRLTRVRREIKAFDAKAFASRTNYWPLMLADLADQI